MFAGLLIGALCAWFLWIFFKALSVRWPESYFAITDIVSQLVSTTPWRYALFRFAPPILVFGIGGVIGARVGISSVWVVAVACVLHGLTTAGRALANTLTKRGLYGRRKLAVYHSGLLVGILVSGMIGWWIATLNWFSNLVPSIDDVRGSLLTALLAAIFATYFVVATRGTTPRPDAIVDKARSQIATQLLEYARTEADRAGTDPILVESIMIVENIQRPAWLRTIERAVGRFVGVGSYGIMQVKSNRPIADKESIDRTVQGHLAGVRIPITKWNRPDPDAIRRAARLHNGDPRFIDLVKEVYETLYQDS